MAIFLCSCTSKKEGSGGSPDSPEVPQTAPLKVEWGEFFLGNETASLTWFKSYQSSDYFLYILKSDVDGYTGPALNPDNDQNFNVLTILHSSTLSYEVSVLSGKKVRYKIRSRNEKGFSPWSQTLEIIGSKIFNSPKISHLWVNERFYIEWSDDVSSSLDPKSVEISRFKNGVLDQTFFINYEDKIFVDYPQYGVYEYKILTSSRAGKSLPKSITASIKENLCFYEDRALGTNGINQYSNETLFDVKTLYKDSTYFRYSLESFEGSSVLYSSYLVNNNWSPLVQTPMNISSFEIAKIGSNAYLVFKTADDLRVLKQTGNTWTSESSFNLGDIGYFKVTSKENLIYIAYDKLSFEGLTTEVLSYNTQTHQWNDLNLGASGSLRQIIFENKLVIQNQNYLSVLDSIWSSRPWTINKFAFDETSSVEIVSEGFLYKDQYIEELWPLSGVLKILDVKNYQKKTMVFTLDNLLFIAVKEDQYWSIRGPSLGLAKTLNPIKSAILVPGPQLWLDFIEQRPSADVGIQVSCPL